MSEAAASKERAVIVCTEFRGVFFGYVSGPTKGVDPIELKRARMAIRWGTTTGIMQLAETGPTANSKISSRADLEVRKVSAVFEMTAAAIEAWEKA